MKFIPVKQSWTKFFAVCNYRLDYRFHALVIFLFAASLPQADACVISCKSNLNVSLDEFGQAVITPSILLQDGSCDPNDFTVDITDPQGNSIGNILTCNYVGMTMIATVTKTSNGNSCSTILNVEDNIKPVIYCADTTVLCIESTTPDDLGFPAAWDNCSTFSNTDLSYSDDFMELPCLSIQGSDTITSQIERTWTITDVNGNTNTCVQMIYLKRATIADVVFPEHRDGIVMPTLDCNDDPSDLTLTGKPTINGKPIELGGHCEIIVSYSDQIIGLCSPTSFQILRTWAAIDDCSSDYALKVQIIKVKDTTPPEVTCPTDITVGTTSNSCDAIVYLPSATATDDCSDFSINASWEFGSGYGPFSNVPVGEHEVTYTATDQCGNASSCQMTVTVIDNVAPVPVCDLNVATNLNNFGTAEVFVNAFDDDSFDNCGVANTAISRDGVNFGASVQFNCADIDSSSISVTMRIWDTSGNINECVVNAIIGDKIDPVIDCPPTAYVECLDDYTNLSLTGEPIVSDNCGIDTFYYNDQMNLSDCGVGSITRIWTAIDKRGNVAACLQMIYVEDNTPLEVVFPADIVTYGCVVDTDTSETGMTQLINADCESTSVIYNDDIFDVSASCYSILRKWEVFNWCVYQPNSGSTDGYWTHTQIIEVRDSIAPMITCPGDTIVGTFAANCGGVFINLPAAIATDCNVQPSITNDSPFADNNGANASGIYPPGIHEVTFLAEDGCGNSTSCSMQIVVVDAKNPTPICLEIAVDLGEDGTVTITPEMINNGSFDNCTATENLIFAVSPNVFTCDELGDQLVTLTVTDEAGNSGVCETIISVQDNNTVCQIPTSKIAGYIMTETGAPVQLTKLHLTGDLEMTVNNDASGYFEFPELPQGGDYTLTPEKNVFAKNGVSSFDLIFMRRHILSLQPLDSPYKIIAADANRSGNISAFDIILFTKLILQIDTVLADNDSWRFVDAGYLFPNPTNPFLSVFPESISFPDLSQDQLSVEFVGVKVGDVNGNANPAQFGASDPRNDGNPLVLKTPNQKLEAGKEYTIPVNATEFEAMLGYQFTLDFDEQALSFLDVEKGELDDINENNFGLSYLDKGLITTNWVSGKSTKLEEGETLFQLKFKALKNGKLSEFITINSKVIEAEAYDSDLQIADVELSFEPIQGDNQIAEESAKLHQNHPNPFAKSTIIGLELPGEGDCFLAFFDITGQQVARKDFYATKGHNEVVIHKEELKKSGLYYYRLTTPSGDSLIKKLIVQ